MSAISAKALNSTLGTESFRSFDELLEDMFSKNRKMHYVPSRYNLFSITKEQELGELSGDVWRQNLSNFNLKNGGVIFIKGDIDLFDHVKLLSTKRMKISRFFPYAIETDEAEGRKGYFMQFEPDSVISLWVEPVKRSDGSYYIDINMDFFGSLSPGEWEYVEDPAVANYEV